MSLSNEASFLVKTFLVSSDACIGASIQVVTSNLDDNLAGSDGEAVDSGSGIDVGDDHACVLLPL